MKDDLLHAVDRDTQAFNKVMYAFKLPKKTEEQIAQKEAAIEEATKQATLVPQSVLERCVESLKLAKEVVLKGNKNSVSDAGVAGLTAQAGAEGAYYNVKINLPGIKDGEFRSTTLKQALSLKEQAVRLGEEIRDIVEKHLESALHTNAD
jgi:glutamate formiminotransferase/formiminotetrahydrofolate cyclodeaminase